MQAKDIMSSPVVTVGPDTSVRDIASLLIERRISAVPVVDDKDRLVGLVSEGDLMRRPETDTEPHHSWWLAAFASPESTSERYLKSHGLTAHDVMTREVITVGLDTPAGKIAEILARRHIKRVPVMDGGKLVGIVSRANLLHGLAARKADTPEVARRSDAEIREKLLRHLRDEGLPDETWINPVVTDGVIHLWGFVRSETEREAVELAAKSGDGVAGVENHLGILRGTARNVMWA